MDDKQTQRDALKACFNFYELSYPRDARKSATAAIQEILNAMPNPYVAKDDLITQCADYYQADRDKISFLGKLAVPTFLVCTALSIAGGILLGSAAFGICGVIVAMVLFAAIWINQPFTARFQVDEKLDALCSAFDTYEIDTDTLRSKLVRNNVTTVPAAQTEIDGSGPRTV